MPSLKVAQLRHTAFYEEILWQANELFLKGVSSIKESLLLFDRNWGNIQLGYSYATLLADGDQVAAEFCSKYASSGAFVLNLRQPPPKRIAWLETALYHAKRFRNRQAEGWHMGNLGSAYRDIGENDKAVHWFEPLCVYNRETMVANNLESRAQEKRDDRGRERQAGRKPDDRSSCQTETSPA